MKRPHICMPVSAAQALILFLTLAVLPACSTPTPAPSPPTFQELASAGQSIYLQKCGVCHGNNGQPANKFTVPLWGTGSTLGSYHGIPLFSDAGDMLNYISKNMPLEAAGSLSSQQYAELTAYILAQAGAVSPSTVFDMEKLGIITIP